LVRGTVRRLALAIISAPTNLGLRPPETGSVPGAAKGPEALREAGLHRQLEALGALDDGVILAGRYRDDLHPGSRRVRNQEAIVEHAQRLAARVGECLQAERPPLVLGGDCSVLMGVGVAVSARGRFGLVHIDGHTDFRHPGNSNTCGSLAGEDLAAVVGLHWPAVSDIAGQSPYFSAVDVMQVGCRPDDEYLSEVSTTIGLTVTATEVHDRGAAVVVGRALEHFSTSGVAGYWIHFDVDVLDPAIVSAVDSPASGGLSAEQAIALISALAPGAIGADITIFDPDLDPGGGQARLLADLIAEAFARLGVEDRTVR